MDVIGPSGIKKPKVGPKRKKARGRKMKKKKVNVPIVSTQVDQGICPYGHPRKIVFKPYIEQPII